MGLSLRVDLLFKFIITWLLCTSFVVFECVNKHYLVTPTLNETKIMFMLIYWLLLCSSHSIINMEIAAYKHFAFTSSIGIKSSYFGMIYLADGTMNK